MKQQHDTQKYPKLQNSQRIALSTEAQSQFQGQQQSVLNSIKNRRLNNLKYAYKTLAQQWLLISSILSAECTLLLNTLTTCIVKKGGLPSHSHRRTSAGGTAITIPMMTLMSIYMLSCPPILVHMTLPIVEESIISDQSPRVWSVVGPITKMCLRILSLKLRMSVWVNANIRIVWSYRNLPKGG